jgi:selenocysteine lyase/cysteine desulfurase
MRARGFARTFDRDNAPLHVAAHSHHPWPDASHAAQTQAWDDAAHLLDHKWEHIFDTVLPAAQRHIARLLNLPDPASLAFGPNTHSFVLRLLSCLPAGWPPRILTTGSEFMSFARQIARLEEDGLVQVTRVATQPFDSFAARFADAARGDDFDLVFVSHVFFDSGFVLPDVAAITDAVHRPESIIVLDGYHGFMALPTDLGALAGRVFYLAGGYKYAMAGEGCCFLHCPPGYGPRPRDTGWYAGFSALEAGAAGVPFAGDGSRFLGATFDATALYRFNAVQDWLNAAGHTVSSMLAQVRVLDETLLTQLDAAPSALSRAELVVPDAARRGRFLAFRTERAGEIVTALAARNIIADHRGDRVRIGFGIYHDTDDALRLAAALREFG